MAFSARHGPLVMIGPPAAGSIFDPDALRAETFITTEPGCVYRHLFDQAWRQIGLKPPRPFAEVGSIEAIVRLVAAGSGYALVPRIAAREAFERGAIAAIPSSGFELVATLDMVWRRRRVQPPSLTLLLTRAGRARRSLKRDDDRLRREEPCPS